MARLKDLILVTLAFTAAALDKLACASVILPIITDKLAKLASTMAALTDLIGLVDSVNADVSDATALCVLGN